MIDDRIQMVVIPMRDHVGHTKTLVDALLADGEADRIVIFDNESKAPRSRRWLDDIQSEPEVEVHRVTGNGVIYAKCWEPAVAEALRVGDATGQLVDLHIFNNDIGTPPGVIGHLSRGLRSPVLPDSVAHMADDVWISYPDYDRRVVQGVDVADAPSVTPRPGTWRKKGMSGFCFTMKPEKRRQGWAPIDKQFRWYCGDGDLCQQMMLAGATAVRVDGLPLDFETRTTSHDKRNRGWAQAMIADDLAYAKRKYADGGGFPMWRKTWGALL